MNHRTPQETTEEKQPKENLLNEPRKKLEELEKKLAEKLLQQNQFLSSIKENNKRLEMVNLIKELQNYYKYREYSELNSPNKNIFVRLAFGADATSAMVTQQPEKFLSAKIGWLEKKLTYFDKRLAELSRPPSPEATKRLQEGELSEDQITYVITSLTDEKERLKNTYAQKLKAVDAEEITSASMQHNGQVKPKNLYTEVPPETQKIMDRMTAINKFILRIQEDKKDGLKSQAAYSLLYAHTMYEELQLLKNDMKPIGLRKFFITGNQNINKIMNTVYQWIPESERLKPTVSMSQYIQQKVFKK